MEGIVQAFRKQGFEFENAAASAEAATLATTFAMDADRLAEQYDLFSFAKKAMADDVSTKLLASFQDHLKRQQDKENREARPRQYGAYGDATFSPQGGSKWESMELDAPAAALTPGKATPTGGPRHTPAPTPPSASSLAQKDRSKRGEVLAAWNSSMLQPESTKAAAAPDADPSPPPSPPVVSPLAELHLQPQQRYMMERLEDKWQAMEQRLGRCAAAAEHALGCAPSHNIACPCPEPCWMVGRIRCESEAAARLTPGSVVLEGSTALSDGAQVALDLSQLQDYRLFPGQVVAVLATSPVAGKVVAQRLLTHLPPPPPAPAYGGSSCAEAAGPSDSGEGLSMVVAAGPFTATDDTAYSPLTELLRTCAELAPDLLVLAGPFVDADSALATSGRLDRTFQDVFQDQVVPMLTTFSEQHPGCRAVLLPAVRDAHHHPVHPTPPFDLHLQQPRPCSTSLPLDDTPPLAVGNLLPLPSPCLFRCRGVTVGATSHDILRHMGSAEAAATSGQQPQDRMAALASHLVGQRSFYPLYPAPRGACLDTSLDAALALTQRPDVLLLPSDLVPFARVAPHRGPGWPDAPAPGSTVCVNPGRATKGKNWGSYAYIRVLPNSDPRALAAAVQDPSLAESGAGASAGSTAEPLPFHHRCCVEVRHL